jgi:hypothetical protein
MALSAGWDIKVPEMEVVPYSRIRKNSTLPSDSASSGGKCPKAFSLPALEEQFLFMGRSVPSGYAGVFGLAPGPKECAIKEDHALHGWSINIVPRSTRGDVKSSPYTQRLRESSPRGTLELLTRAKMRQVGERIAKRRDLLVNGTLAANHSPAIVVPLRSRYQLELPLRALPALLDKQLESAPSSDERPDAAEKELKAIVDPNVEAIFIPGQLQLDLLQKKLNLLRSTSAVTLLQFAERR